MGRENGLRRHQGRWLASAVGLCLAGQAAAHASGCEGLLAGLTEAQRAKFSLAQEACPGGSVTARDDVLADRQDRQPVQRPVVPSFASIAMPSPAWQPSRSSARMQVATPNAMRFAAEFDAAASSYDIDPLLLHAIAHVESRHNPKAVSPAGAMGIMQVMPATARRFGVERAADLHDARTNVNVSAMYLKTLQKRFGNDLPLVIAAYNAGEGRVERCGRCIPAITETRNYVRDVLAQYDALKAAANRVATATALR